MSKPAKLLLRWDINGDKESEYFEFMVSEFIPAINRLGINDIQAWYTLYGACEQIMFSGVADSSEQMHHILLSESWQNLKERLISLVVNYDQKVIGNARSGFQI